MAYRVEFDPALNTIVVTLDAEHGREQFSASIVAIRAQLDQRASPAHLMVDARAELRWTLVDMIEGISMAALSPDALFRHPMLCTSLMVSPDPVTTLMVAQADRLGYLHGRVLHFHTIEEARAWLCQQRPVHEDSAQTR